MRHLWLPFAIPLLSLVACRGPSEEGGSGGVPDTLLSLGPPPIMVALDDFRPWIPAGTDTGGGCREDHYMTERGFHAVTWRRDDGDGRWWSVDVATDSARAVRRYFEDRYAGSSGRTMIHVDFAGGHGSAENSIPGAPGQIARGDAAAVFRALNLDDPSGRAGRALERCRLSLDPWGALTRLPDSLLPPPAPRPAPRVPGFDRTFLGNEPGEGYLAELGSSFEGLRWLRAVILPLYSRPGDDVSRWLARGWVIRPAATVEWREWTAAGWRGVGGESFALSVLDLRDDGWFRVRYTAPDTSSDGTAWAHASQLAFGDIDLRLVRWEEHFLRGRMTVFRTSGTHYLREAPGAGGVVLDSLISPDLWQGRTDVRHTFSALEMRGDWMKVRVEWPGRWCSSAGADRTREGWVRWRDSVNGVMLWTGSLIC